MRLYRRHVGLAERWPMSDIRHARMDDAIDGHGGRIHAVRRHQLVVSLEIGRRDTELSAASGTGCHLAIDEKVMPEQSASLVDAAFPDEPPDTGAGDDKVFVPNRIDLLSTKAVLAPQRAEQ